MIVVGTFNLFSTLNGTAKFQKWEKYIANGGVCDEELTRKIAPYIKWTLITMNLGRFFLVILSNWYPRITRTYLYYQLIILSLNFTLPIDGGDLRTHMFFLLLFEAYILLHYSFKMACILFLLC